MTWRPDYRASLESWIVVDPADERRAFNRVALGGDEEPLRFWSEKAAQIHADSLNRKEANN